MSRRVARTRARIEQALIELAAERDYDAITVEDILERAEVARATFYAHYADKDGVVDEIAQATLEIISARTQVALSENWPQTSGTVTEAFFTVVGENRGAVLLILRGAAHARPLHEWLDSIAAVQEREIRSRDEAFGKTPRIPHDLLATAFAWQMVAVLRWWLPQADVITPAEISRRFRELNQFGEAWVRRLDINAVGLDWDRAD